MMAPRRVGASRQRPSSSRRRQGRPQKVVGKSVRDRSAIIFQQPARLKIQCSSAGSAASPAYACSSKIN
jgi:hypothetical protein